MNQHFSVKGFQILTFWGIVVHYKIFENSFCKKVFFSSIFWQERCWQYWKNKNAKNHKSTTVYRRPNVCVTYIFQVVCCLLQILRIGKIYNFLIFVELKNIRHIKYIYLKTLQKLGHFMVNFMIKTVKF